MLKTHIENLFKTLYKGLAIHKALLIMEQLQNKNLMNKEE